jgi:probable HAF family extracellular repeat protein
MAALIQNLNEGIPKPVSKWVILRDSKHRDQELNTLRLVIGPFFRMSLNLKSLGLICVICFASSASAQTLYRITRIPTPQGDNSSALGVNSKGEVVGYSFQGEDYQAFFYSPSDPSVTNLGSLGGKINAACAINDDGQVVGYSQDGNGDLLAFTFSRNKPITSLGTLDGASSSEAFGINNHGTVVGDSQSGTQNHHPVLFSGDSVQDLGLGSSNEPDAIETAFAINDAGQIVGRHSAGQNAFHAFSVLNGNTTDFSTLGGTNGEALAINKNGLVVGDSDTADGSPHAFVFDHAQLRDLGTLPGFGTASYARGINNSGSIVGESDNADQKRAFLFTKGRLVQLDKLAGNLSESGFNSLDVAYDINDKGWIVGYGTTTDHLAAAFLAIPEGRDNQGPAGSTPQPQAQQIEGPPRPQPQGPSQEQSISESDQNDYDVFYTGLSSDEGNWVEAGNYGYCFRPRVTETWRPYRDGHWVWTDRGWYWDSNERFGWATYHYGRWVNIRGTGWCWVPGNQWAPAWVSWRESNENVGWAPLPPEADVSAQQPISSWSDSYYGIGPAAYAFISYSHWREPSYARYIVRPERNAQIINETRNVTNVVTNNNVINNFGPPVQNVARRTNQNIQQVQLAFNPATSRRASYGQTRQGNQLNVTAPPTTLKAQAAQGPPVQSRIVNPQVEKGWQGIKSQNAEKLKKTIAEQNPQPKDLSRPAPFVNPQTGHKGATESFVAPGSPTPDPERKTPLNLSKPGPTSPQANISPGPSPKGPVLEKKPVPANLLGSKPGSPGSQPTAKPTPKPTGNLPPGQNPSHPSPPSQSAVTPTQEQKPETLPLPASPRGPANLITPTPTSKPHLPSNPQAPKPIPTPLPSPANGTPPKPTPEVKVAPLEITAPKPTQVPTTHTQPRVVPNSTPQLGGAPPQKQEIRTPAPRVVPTPALAPRVVHTPSTEPAARKSAPPKEEIKNPPPVHHPSAPQPRVVHTTPVQPPVHNAPSPRQEFKPAPSVQHAPPQPRVAHPAPAQAPSQKAPPANHPQRPQSAQKHEPAKGKPTPVP